jgi:hypothetical protein
MSSKPLLTEPGLVRRVVEKLHANNIHGRDLYQWIVDFAHVDLDVLKEVLREMRDTSPKAETA